MVRAMELDSPHLSWLMELSEGVLGLHSFGSVLVFNKVLWRTSGSSVYFKKKLTRLRAAGERIWCRQSS